jgi:hypothetical protein
MIRLRRIHAVGELILIDARIGSSRAYCRSGCLFRARPISHALKNVSARVLETFLPALFPLFPIALGIVR